MIDYIVGGRMFIKPPWYRELITVVTLFPGNSIIFLNARL